MKKMKFFAMAFAAIVAVAFNACKPQNEPKPDDGGDGDKTPTQVEVKLNEMSVLTYDGESLYKDFEQYSAVFTNETTKEQYSVTLNSYFNDLKAPVESTYSIITDELTKSDQAKVTKSIGETKVEAESGNIVVKGNEAEMEITMNITLADGTIEILHYKGAVSVVDIDFGGLSEPTSPVNLTIEADTAIYAFNPASGNYLTQTQILMIDLKHGLEVELFLFYQSEANATATEQPVGTFKLNSQPTKTDDFAQVGDYFIYYYSYISTGKFPAVATISAYDTQGNNTATFFPQTGDIVIAKGEGDTYKITLNNFVTYNGSKFSAKEFVANKYVAQGSAPMKIAAKPLQKFNISLFSNMELPAMELAR